MCGFGTSQSAPTTQLSTQSTQADPRAAAMYSSAWNNAQIAAQRPFTPYSNDPNAFVAPMNSTQLSAVNDIYGMQNAGNPYYQAAPGMAYASGNTSAAGLAPSYMSPYLDSVAAATMGILGQQQGQQQNQLSGDIAKNGQWGNSRSGVERALLSGQQNLATANTISNLYNTGYNSALGAAQTDLQRQLAAAQGLGTAGQTGAQNLLGAGTVGQQTQQAGLGALYNQFLMQQQYPFQVAQFLSSTAAGLGPGYGSTTSGYQNSQQPLSFFGNPLSDPSLKVGAEGDEPEIIGETHDGQEIYRYRLINPDTGEVGPVQIGLMADEVQKRRPDAIGDYKGFKTVDYAKATDGAARIGGLGRDDYAAGGSIEDLLREHQAMYSGLGKRAKAAYDQQYRLREMERQISNLTKDGGFLLPGTNADMRLEVAKAANTFSTMFGGGPIFDPNNVAAGENLAKDSTQLGFATARQLGHEPGFIVSQSIKANPSMENSPMAFKRIVAGLREAANYEQDRLQFLESYRGKYQTTAGADALFRKLNPPEAYARRAILSTIDEEDLRHLREMPKDKLLSRKKKIDKEYGEGTTNLLAGGE